MSSFQGIRVPLVTPFQNGAIDFVGLRRLVMGLAGNNLAELLQFQNEILKRPVAGLLVPPTYYIRPSQAGLEAFFKLLPMPPASRSFFTTSRTAPAWLSNRRPCSTSSPMSASSRSRTAAATNPIPF